MSGLLQTLKKFENMSRWIFPSIGNSPVRKCIAGVGANLLSFSIDFSNFLWNNARGSKCAVCSENVNFNCSSKCHVVWSREIPGITIFSPAGS